jgi:hypothetical protein
MRGFLIVPIVVTLARASAPLGAARPLPRSRPEDDDEVVRPLPRSRPEDDDEDVEHRPRTDVAKVGGKDDDEDKRRAVNDDEDDDEGKRLSNDDEDDDESDGFEKLNHELWKLSAAESEQRFGQHKPRLPTPPHQDKIDHFVVLYMENHAADNMFGCMGLPGYDGIDKGHSLPKDPPDPTKGHFNVTCGTAPYVCSGGPGYDTFAGKFAPGGNPHAYPYSPQDDKWSALHGASEGGTAVRMYSPEQIPIKAAIASNFGVFNKLYTAVPSASSPNHLFTQSATSCGMQCNGLYNDCGGKDVSFPQKTIYDSLRWVRMVHVCMVHMYGTCVWYMRMVRRVRMV